MIFINLFLLKAFAVFGLVGFFASALAILFLIPDYQKSLEPEENVNLSV